MTKLLAAAAFIAMLIAFPALAGASPQPTGICIHQTASDVSDKLVELDAKRRGEWFKTFPNAKKGNIVIEAVKGKNGERVVRAYVKK